ncbi:hypothetical protein [Agaribacter flavus]|uniref:Nudix hydrolase domain-containing protein n=1 Tax=Agaribacter flavus TaxID=1902781 RepID=A0ABV7FSJ1_9ALTE
MNETIGDLIMEREDVFAVARSKPAIWKEKYYLVICAYKEKVFAADWTDEEKSTIQRWKWWTLDEMKSQNVDTFKPETIPDLMATILEKQKSA